MRARLASVVLVSAACAGGLQQATAADAGAGIFAAHCAVCHGPRAEGVPGTFPPLGAQIRAFAAGPTGRDYVVMAVSSGLIGSVSVGGNTYQGAMPAQSMLSEAEVAAVLTYVASGLGNGKPISKAFSAAEVSEIRGRHGRLSGVAALALRPASN